MTNETSLRWRRVFHVKAQTPEHVLMPKASLKGGLSAQVSFNENLVTWGLLQAIGITESKF